MGRLNQTGDEQRSKEQNIKDALDPQIKELEERVISKFIEGMFVGNKIKRTPAYETNLVETEYNEICDEFWSDIYF